MIKSGNHSLEDAVKHMHYAIQKHKLEEFRELLEECQSMFDLSHMTGYECMSKLSRRNSGDSPLHVAAQHGCIDILRFLVEEKGTVPVDLRNHDRKTPLHNAAQFSQLECTTYLLEKGADVNALKKADWTPLMLACTKQDYAVVAELIRWGADPLFKNKDGWNSFHIACREGDIKIVTMVQETLREATPTRLQLLVNSSSRNGRKPLHTAALHGHKGVVDYIIKNKINDLEDIDNCGTTPIMDACRSGVLELIDLFVENNANINVVNKSGYNCLHVAAEAGLPDVIKHLVRKYGFELQVPVKGGKIMPLDIAAKEKNEDAVEAILLLQAKSPGLLNLKEK